MFRKHSWRSFIWLTSHCWIKQSRWSSGEDCIWTHWWWLHSCFQELSPQTLVYHTCQWHSIIFYKRYIVIPLPPGYKSLWHTIRLFYVPAATATDMISGKLFLLMLETTLLWKTRYGKRTFYWPGGFKGFYWPFYSKCEGILLLKCNAFPISFHEIGITRLLTHRSQ